MAGLGWMKKALVGGASKNERKAKGVVNKATQLVADLSSLSDEELSARAHSLVTKQGVSDPAHFLAILSIAAHRSLGFEPFACQLKACWCLLGGDVIHMATGEGKTLVGAMAAVGYALQNKRVHCITVNDYLAERDATWMRPLVTFFGLSVGAIGEKLSPDTRRDIYARDIIYGPVSEIGFDVLRDQLVTKRAQAVRSFADVAIVDEADSVLIDEALVPLVLAGSQPGVAPTGKITDIVKHLVAGRDFTTDDERLNVFLTDEGARRVEEMLGITSLYDDENVGTTLVQVNLALHAQELLIRDVHYIIRNGKVALIDASKGRVADLQRWPDGLQAAVEAKEGLAVTEGGRILDTITVQALMGRYPQICGMTGTAVEASEQLRQFYDLRVAEIERNHELVRYDEADRVYDTQEHKNVAIIDEIRRLHETGQPVLVGTHDVAESEFIAGKLAEYEIDVNVLNAKNDAEEAPIIAQAGDLGRVTVSTQMAGRGTDIRLGGPDESMRDQVVRAGGLAVIGTGRYKSSRLDNQLRGRAGRQGDPGSSLFFVSLKDDVVTTGGAGEDVRAEPDQYGQIDSKRIRDFIEHCQRVTEGQLLEIHANTWKYNKLISDQRTIIDKRRAEILDTEAALDYFSKRQPERIEQLQQSGVDHDTLVQAARDIMLYFLDNGWADHLALLDDVRESIHLRAIARETPIDEFHRIAVAEFKNLAEKAMESAGETFATIRIDADGAHLEDEGLSRPSATWTYMVNDNPLSSRGNPLKKAVNVLFKHRG